MAIYGGGDASCTRDLYTKTLVVEFPKFVHLLMFVFKNLLLHVNANKYVKCVCACVRACVRVCAIW